MFKLKTAVKGSPAIESVLVGAERRSAALQEMASELAVLREKAATLDCGMLAYLLAMAEDEALDEDRRAT